MLRRLRSILLVHVLLAIATSADAREPRSRLELVDVRRVWDRARHNAFTSLIRFRDQWFLVFREAPYHGVPKMGQMPGKARVLCSEAGVRWESVALLDYGADQDVRDPKLSIARDGRLMVNAAVAPHAQKNTRQSLAWFSHDGKRWIIRAFVDIEHILHRSHECGVLLGRNAEPLYPPGLNAVFFSRPCTVVRLTASTTSSSTSFPANRVSVQRARPSRRNEQTTGRPRKRPRPSATWKAPPSGRRVQAMRNSEYLHCG